MNPASQKKSAAAWNQKSVQAKLKKRVTETSEGSSNDWVLYLAKKGRQFTIVVPIWCHKVQNQLQEKDYPKLNSSKSDRTEQ